MKATRTTFFNAVSISKETRELTSQSTGQPFTVVTFTIKDEDGDALIVECFVKDGTTL